MQEGHVPGKKSKSAEQPLGWVVQSTLQWLAVKPPSSFEFGYPLVGHWKVAYGF